MYPTKVLSCVLSSLIESEYVTENNNTWVSHNKAYRWQAVISVNAQPHSWAGSTTPYFYNGLDQKLVGVEGAEPIYQALA